MFISLGQLKIISLPFLNPNRERNSSTREVTSWYLRLGQSDNSLDFGLVGKNTTPGIPVTR
jgi:hypothetical protein